MFVFAMVLQLAAQIDAAPAAVVQPASVAVIWHISSAPYADASVRAAANALEAPGDLSPILRALQAHPRARFALAIDADALSALEMVRTGGTALSEVVAGHWNAADARAPDLARILTRLPVADKQLSDSPAFKRYAELAATVRHALDVETAPHVRANDLVELAGLAALNRLATFGAIPSNSKLLRKSAMSRAEAASLVAQLSSADADALDVMKALAAQGQLEILADPAGEPILPVLVDNGGRTSLDPNFVQLGAFADAEYLVTDALRWARKESPEGAAPGIFSPHGAYDDKTAALLVSRGAAFALFSDRVLASAPAGGSLAAVTASDSAAFHAYAVQATSSRALPALFWSEDESIAISALPSDSPPTAMGERMAIFAGKAAQSLGPAASALVVLRIDADGAWAQRADRAAVVDHLAAALSRAGVDAVTPGQYMRARHLGVTAYGFAPSSDEGSLSAWTSDSNQQSMWSAIADARKAAGGDAALGSDATRTPLLQAEASHWYDSILLAQPKEQISATVAAFRKLVEQVYRAAGKTAPANIAPLVAASPTPAPTPSP
ncbi:MAG TPA: hypothetical protein VN934_01025 [Candidatus Tumulicola sp.]|nr:hypothetical protein [Candidatus Tumulicola sp.]